MTGHRYPGYDVLAKRFSESWNEKTRRVIDARLGLPRDPRFFNEEEWRTLEAICARIIPQPTNRPPVPIAALVDTELFEARGEGYRDARLPPAGVCWRAGLTAIEAESRQRWNVAFAALDSAEQDELLHMAQAGELTGDHWASMRCDLFFAKRLLPDIATSYYSHPTAWSEIGFGGPASPRGYVRMNFDRRDPWEPVEDRSDDELSARDVNARIR